MKIAMHRGRYLAVAIIAFLAGEFAAASIGTESAPPDTPPGLAAAGQAHADLPQDDMTFEKGGIE